MDIQVIVDGLFLSRAQFAITTVYHFFFVPLTLGLSTLVALMQTRWALGGDETYKRMARFWGTLFLINFAMGVVTGIVQEFQFGLNWSEYSRYVGDIFGAPLAIEALLAFFLESTFLGVWIFGWNRLPKHIHTGSIWLVAIGANISALWILIANSFMQHPLGYTVRNGRAEMTDFLALVTNPYVWLQFPHVFFAGISTAAFFVLGISAYHLLRKDSDHDFFGRSFRMAAVYGLVGTLFVILVGHSQTQQLIEVQPMKMAAAEALWETEDPAALSLFTFGDEANRRDIFAIRVSPLLSLLAYGTTEGEVRGVNDLQAEYEQKYGAGNYVPPVAISYWSFRAMIGAGFAMLLLAVVAVLLSWRRAEGRFRLVLLALLLAIPLPYLANSTGWLLAEMGRQPWIVYGLMRTEQGISPTVPVWMVAFSLVGFTLIYGALMLVDIYLLVKYARVVPAAESDESGMAEAY